MDWRACYRTGHIPWDKGEPHPELPFLLETYRELFSGASRVLVPGCGLGHDVALIAPVVSGPLLGLDLVEEAINAARQRYSIQGVSWEVGDLFRWPLGREGWYDLVWEHTCFCAISPDRRSEYVAAMTALIPKGGCLLGIFFLDPNCPRDEGPPFYLSLDDLKALFDGAFELEWSFQPVKTYESRLGEGRELVILWRRL